MAAHFFLQSWNDPAKKIDLPNGTTYLGKYETGGPDPRCRKHQVQLKTDGDVVNLSFVGKYPMCVIKKEAKLRTFIRKNEPIRLFPGDSFTLLFDNYPWKLYSYDNILSPTLEEERERKISELEKRKKLAKKNDDIENNNNHNNSQDEVPAAKRLKVKDAPAVVKKSASKDQIPTSFSSKSSDSILVDKYQNNSTTELLPIPDSGSSLELPIDNIYSDFPAEDFEALELARKKREQEENDSKLAQELSRQFEMEAAEELKQKKQIEPEKTQKHNLSSSLLPNPSNSKSTSIHSILASNGPTHSLSKSAKNQTKNVSDSSTTNENKTQNNQKQKKSDEIIDLSDEGSPPLSHSFKDDSDNDELSSNPKKARMLPSSLQTKSSNRVISGTSLPSVKRADKREQSSERITNNKKENKPRQLEMRDSDDESHELEDSDEYDAFLNKDKQEDISALGQLKQNAVRKNTKTFGKKTDRRPFN